MRVAIALAVVALAAPVAAVGAARLTADEVRVGSHPAAVRVVVDFTGTGRLEPGQVMLRRPASLLRRGRAKVDVRGRGVRADAGPVRAHGVRVRVAERRGRAIVKVRAAARRFKLVSAGVLHGPERLVLDLWRARPPAGRAAIRNDGCLALDEAVVGADRVRARGRALRRLFENALVVQLRAPHGRVLAARPATVVRGRWSRAVPYEVARETVATLEAAVFSAKDGSLECLAQVPVTLRPREGAGATGRRSPARRACRAASPSPCQA